MIHGPDLRIRLHSTAFSAAATGSAPHPDLAEAGTAT